jgi:hypothetical protein
MIFINDTVHGSNIPDPTIKGFQVIFPLRAETYGAGGFKGKASGEHDRTSLGSGSRMLRWK